MREKDLDYGKSQYMHATIYCKMTVWKPGLELAIYLLELKYLY